jgi:hypothetical protein
MLSGLKFLQSCTFRGFRLVIICRVTRIKKDGGQIVSDLCLLQAHCKMIWTNSSSIKVTKVADDLPALVNLLPMYTRSEDTSPLILEIKHANCLVVWGLRCAVPKEKCNS